MDGLFDFLTVCSLVVLVASLLIAIGRWYHQVRSTSITHGEAKAAWFAGIGIMISVMIYSAVLCFSGYIEVKEPISKTLLLTLEFFTFSLDVTTKDVELASVGISISPECFHALGNTLYIAASATTLGTILSFATKRLVMRTLRISSWFFDTYVFSRVNQSSLTLAESIQRHYTGGDKRSGFGFGFGPRCQIIFADANLENDRLYAEVQDRGFIYIDAVTNAVVKRCRSGKRSALHVILSSENEVENLHEGMRLANLLSELVVNRKLKSKPTLHVFAASSAAESHVDRMISNAADPIEKHVENLDGKAKYSLIDRTPEIRRIDWTRNVVQQLLIDHPLFITRSVPQGFADDAHRIQELTEELYTHTKRRIVIVGAGNMGYEFLKGATWCCQSLSSTTRIDVIDKDADKIENRFRMEAPGLYPAAVAGSADVPKIAFYAYDVRSTDYYDYLQRHAGIPGKAGDCYITYMLFSLGNDLVNTETAKRTKEILEYFRLTSHAAASPFMGVVVDDQELANSIENIENAKRQTYDLVPIGDEHAIFSFENIFNPNLEMMSECVNFAYSEGYKIPLDDKAQIKEKWREAKEDYDKYEYNRRSSRASAIFLKYDLYEYARMLYGNGAEQSDLPNVKDWLMDSIDDPYDSNPRLAELLDAYDRDIKLSADNSDKSMRGKLMELEHMRWNAYLWTEGFRTCEEDVFEAVFKETGKTQHQLARIHICLVPFAELAEVDEWDHATRVRVKREELKNSSVGEAGVQEALPKKAKPYQYNDRDIIENLSHIVRKVPAADIRNPKAKRHLLPFARSGKD